MRGLLQGSTGRLLSARLLAWAALALASLAGTPAAASICSVSSPSPPTVTIGALSPAAFQAGKAGTLATAAGFSCPGSLITLLTTGNITATMTSTNGFALVGPSRIAYTAAANPSGTVPFTPAGSTPVAPRSSTPTQYRQNNVLNVAGLLGGSNVNLQLYLTPATPMTLLAPGHYTDHITIDWSWSICSGLLGALGGCVGTADSGTGRSVIDVDLVVTRDLAMNMTQTITWDPVNKSQNPRALPGSKRRMTITVTNPDILTLDTGSLQVILPTPVGLVPALDGDGASSTAAITFTDGSPTSAVTARYANPGDATDNVDFSSDGGKTWTFQPTAGDLASEGSVTQIRISPKGAMAPNSSFSVSAAYLSR